MHFRFGITDDWTWLNLSAATLIINYWVQVGRWRAHGARNQGDLSGLWTLQSYIEPRYGSSAQSDMFHHFPVCIGWPLES